MSWKTSTCPSQPAPAPMPMVGIATVAVIFAPSSAGTLSTTIENAPAALNRRGVGQEFLAIALDRKPPS